jgi:hypothetical protein
MYGITTAISVANNPSPTAHPPIVQTTRIVLPRESLAALVGGLVMLLIEHVGLFDSQWPLLRTLV